LDKNQIYDLAIVGAGAAGLQLLYEYLQVPENVDSRILLIDSGDRSKKSWCFWAASGHESFPFLIEKSWKKVTYRYTNSVRETQEIDNLGYHYISSTNFFTYFFDQFIPAHPQITHQTGWVDSLTELESVVDIQIKDGSTFQAKRVADARLTKRSTSEKPVLSQHFWGKFVEFEEDTLDSQSATLMDFSQTQTSTDYAVFHYILPFSSRKGLIETTVFSKEGYDEAAYEAHWNQYMEANFAGKNYKVLEEERGTIPMTLTDTPQKMGKIFAIGTASGQVKASTGYAFTRMHADAKERVQQRSIHRKPRYVFYDSILLHMIQTENKVIPQVMDQLFGRIPFARVLNFLDEKTSIWQEIKLFSQLQIPLFLKHLVLKNR
jgi:lycopene beta-cyclase